MLALRRFPVLWRCCAYTGMALLRLHGDGAAAPSSFHGLSSAEPTSTSLIRMASSLSHTLCPECSCSSPRDHFPKPRNQMRLIAAAVTVEVAGTGAGAGCTCGNCTYPPLNLTF